ncbi:hypothetical protein [Geothrix oryzisoli]|uniref:hypothetical protein n=1 Tax=Geothrix oryzisoli TaxID=2922721 RepID=UPI001FABAD0A|nr:hypothetical protein [Geothrix oryzisoli]
MAVKYTAKLTCRSFDDHDAKPPLKPPFVEADSYRPLSDARVACGPDSLHRIQLDADVWTDDGRERDLTVGFTQHVMRSSREAIYGSEADGGAVGVVRYVIPPNCLDGAPDQALPFYDLNARTLHPGDKDQPAHIHLEDRPDSSVNSRMADLATGELRRLMSFKVDESFLISLLVRQKGSETVLDPVPIAQWQWGYEYLFTWDEQGKPTLMESRFERLTAVEPCSVAGIRFDGASAGTLFKEEVEWRAPTKAKPVLEAAREAAVQAQLGAHLAAPIGVPSDRASASGSLPSLSSPERGSLAAKAGPPRSSQAMRSQRVEQMRAEARAEAARRAAARAQ